MIKLSVLTIAISVGFTGWWASKLNAGPFIYLHRAPASIEQAYSHYWKEFLSSRKIESISFGGRLEREFRVVPVEINGELSNDKWEMRNGLTGPVLIQLEDSTGVLKIWWEIPSDTSFDTALDILHEQSTAILQKYEEILKVKSTF